MCSFVYFLLYTLELFAVLCYALPPPLSLPLCALHRVGLWPSVVQRKNAWKAKN